MADFTFGSMTVKRDKGTDGFVEWDEINVWDNGAIVYSTPFSEALDIPNHIPALNAINAYFAQDSEKVQYIHNFTKIDRDVIRSILDLAQEFDE